MIVILMKCLAIRAMAVFLIHVKVPEFGLLGVVEAFSVYHEVWASFFQVCFGFVTSLVAVLAFKKAKETILQPIRSEVVKQQIPLFLDLLALLDPYSGRSNSSLLERLDYRRILEINLACAFDDLFPKVNVYKGYQSEIAHSLCMATPAFENDLEIATFFEDSEAKEGVVETLTMDQRKERKLANAMEGKLDIYLFHVTNKHHLFMQ